jgi:hypothetical protein
MDRLVRFFVGGKVKVNGEFEGMHEEVHFFSAAPTFVDVVGQCRDKFGWPQMLRGRFDCGNGRPHYVLMGLSCEDEWKNYIEVVKSSSVRCLEVVVEKACIPSVVDNVDVDPLENLTQDEAVVVRGVCRSYEVGVLDDEFDEEVFTEDGIHDMDDISQGSEDDEDIDDLTSGPSSSDDVMEDGYRSQPSSDNESDCFEPGFTESLGLPCDGSLRMEYNEEELRQLKAVHVEVPSVPNFMDISMVDQAVCDTGLSLLDESVLEIKKGSVFDTLDHLKYFLMDYAVRYHRPYYVSHCEKNKRYTVLCKHSCGWGVWARKLRNDKWKIRNVKQPHTCRTSRAKGEHGQNTGRYLGRRLVGIVRADSDTSVSSLIESIYGFTGYRVKYSKAWRAKQHAIELLWGDWKEAYNQVPRILTAMKHFNPGLRWYPYVGRIVTDVDGIPKHVLQRVFWCFSQCAEAFNHCRPLILVDGTFLTGKYRGVLMIAVAVDPDNQLVPLAFALAEGENDDSWCWFMKLVRQNVLRSSRKICMISDRHHGLLKAAREDVDGRAPLEHRWCMRHFAANIWRRQKKKEVVQKLKSLCGCRTKEKFESTLHELHKVLNVTAKRWLEEQMPQKEKWALAFDTGGLRYGVMTTNSSESFNKVFKGIRAVPVSAIVEYSFTKCNEYFVNRWNMARVSKEKWGRAGRKHLDVSETIASNQVGEAFGPSRLVYNIRSAGGTNPGGEKYGGRNYRVDLDKGECSCNIPQLYHMPCSHVITACKCRGLNQESEKFMSPLYLTSNTLKVWESSFEPYLDPSQWPEYYGLDYVPDPELVKAKKGRRKKKRLRGEMDAANGYGDDMYGCGDFDEAPTHVRCSKCHKTGHNAATHAKHLKANKLAKLNASTSGSRVGKVHIFVVTTSFICYVFGYYIFHNL